MCGQRPLWQKEKPSLEKLLKLHKSKRKKLLSEKKRLLYLKGELRILRQQSVVDQLASAAHTEGEHEDIQIEETPSVPTVEVAMKESHEDLIPEVVAPGHIEDVQMEDAPAQAEPEVQGELDIHGEPTASAPADQFQEGLVEDTSDEDDEPVVGSGELEPPGPSLEESGPSEPCVAEDVSVGPSGPSKQVKLVVGPTGPQVSVEEVVVPPGPSDPPSLQTPAPSSPPTSFTAPPAPEPSKKPLHKPISSPTASSSSPTPSSSIPPTTSEAPPASSSFAGPSLADPSSAGPSTQPPPTSSFASFH
ncbi:hypothetical protein Taro_033835 [Colocasia esculenta]|uniref:Uncharacterized protein n=1 Tax=Colocasia esculenta TaxID=4460 RepID=A0A843W846_COLES|nr:hypothetical protein [Colocasia esculenta]